MGRLRGLTTSARPVRLALGVRILPMTPNGRDGSPADKTICR